MSLQDELITVERGFWTEGADYYKKNLDDIRDGLRRDGRCVQERRDCRDNPGANRWRDLSIEPKGFLEPAPGFAILTYQVQAKRKTGEPYGGVVTSGYVKRNGEWKMVFHQQTPKAIAAH